MRIKLFVITLLAASLASGCTVTQKLSPSDKERISKLYINKDVKKADQLYYYRRTPSRFPFNLVDPGNVEESRQLEKFTRDNNILIEEIVYRNFFDTLKRANQYQLVDEMESADAVVNIEVYQYGFIRTVFSSEIVPLVGVKCEMYDVKGNKLWQAGDRTLPLGNPAEPFSLEDMQTNPDLIRRAWEIASSEIAKNIVAEL